MVLRMARMSEMRDPKETGTHVTRVSRFSLEIYDRWAFNHNIPAKERTAFRDSLIIASMLQLTRIYMKPLITWRYSTTHSEMIRKLCSELFSATALM